MGVQSASKTVTETMDKEVTIDNASEKERGNTSLLGAILTFDFAILPIILIFLIDWTVKTDFDPSYFKVPDVPYIGGLTPNTILTKVEKLHSGEVEAPESVVYHKGHLYASTSGGKVVDIFNGELKTLAILKTDNCVPDSWNENCGRPLGLRIDGDNNLLYAADADLGVFQINITNGDSNMIYSSSRHIGGKPSRFINDIAIGKDGTLYVTDMSTKWSRKNSILMSLENRETGRLLKIDVKSGELSVLLPDISGANGVEISPNEDFVLISESPMCRVLKYHLKGPKAGQKEVFANLPGVPDNIRKSKSGGYWVAMAMARHPTRLWAYEIAATRPWLRRIASKILPDSFLRHLMHIPYGLIVELNEKGTIMRSFHDPTGKILPAVSHVDDQGSVMYLASFTTDYISKIDLKNV